MSAPRHLSRVLDEILSCALTLPRNELLGERLTLSGVAKSLRQKAPEQIRPAAWDDLEGMIEKISEALGEPGCYAVEEIWNGARTDGSTEGAKEDPSAIEALKSLEEIATGTGHDIAVYQALQKLHLLESDDV